MQILLNVSEVVIRLGFTFRDVRQNYDEVIFLLFYFPSFIWDSCTLHRITDPVCHGRQPEFSGTLPSGC